jgi:glycosyltransferase involved in cell wall biosynthesis
LPSGAARRWALCIGAAREAARMPANVGFVSTRFAGTDGVSLEAAKWAEVLWESGHVSFWYAGSLDRAADISLCIPEAHFSHAENHWINSQLWGRTSRDGAVSRRIHALAAYLKGTLYEFVQRFELDVLIIQNALSIPMHIPLGIAITEFLLETEMPAIAHHHDFYWERDRFQISNVSDYLEMAFPPRIPHLQHVVINQAARDMLAWRKGVPCILIPNVFDYDNPPAPMDQYAADLRHEIGLGEHDRMVLQPTRIVPRKGIEHAITLLRRLRDPLCKLVISHSSGDEGDDYLEQLLELTQDEGIDLVLCGDRIADRRQLDGSGKKIYVLKDLYPHADLVTFPSLYEGFGNALLEAIYFRVPVAVNRYSVLIRDIEPKGLRMPSMDGFVNRQMVSEVRRILQDRSYRQALVEHNYALAKRYYGYPVLRHGLRILFENIWHQTE